MTDIFRRWRLCQQLHESGPRPVLEALIAVECGQTLDEVLEEFARIPPELYRATLYFYGALADDGGFQC